jgi:hypothetical protein
MVQRRSNSVHNVLMFFCHNRHWVHWTSEIGTHQQVTDRGCSRQ